MLLTRKANGASAIAPTSSSDNSHSPFVHSLRRGLANAMPTMDRRGFLRRSGLGVGVGLAAGQLTLMRKSQAAEALGLSLRTAERNWTYARTWLHRDLR